MREAAEVQSGTISLNTRIEDEKEFRHRSLNRQRDYEETLKQLAGEVVGDHMSIDLYDKRSKLRGNIADEKEKRRKSSAIQKVLAREKDELTSSATGMPAANSTRGQTRLPFKPRPTAPDASSSGRISSHQSLAMGFSRTFTPLLCGSLLTSSFSRGSSSNGRL